MSIRGVGFDLDYTLAVPTRDRETLLAEAIETVGAPSFSRDVYIDAHSNHLTAESRAPIFADILGEDSGVDPEQLAAAYREAVTQALVPIPGAESLLRTLRSTYRLGLLTNGPVKAQRSKIEFLGWESLFDTTLVTGELSAGKPDAVPFELLLDELGTEASETVYIGDTPDDDIQGANNAGLTSIQVLFAGGPEPDPRADFTIQREQLAAELPDLIASI